MKAQIKLRRKCGNLLWKWEAQINGSQLVIRYGVNDKFLVTFVKIKPKAGRDFNQEAIKELYKRTQKQIKKGYTLFKETGFRRVTAAYNVVEVQAMHKVECNKKKEFILGVTSQKMLELMKKEL